MIEGNYKHIDLGHIYEIAGDDDEFVIEIINNFLVATPKSFEKLITALQSNSADDILFIAHKLKGSFRFIGGFTMGNLMEELEEKCKKAGAIENLNELTFQYRELLLATEAELKNLLSKMVTK
jgi:HPt (histidine-containing phosphotransfer) domain-containing protein